MPETHAIPQRTPLPVIAAVDAVEALSIPLDAFLALEALLEQPLEATCREVNREHISALLGLINTRLFIDLKEAQSAVRIAVHHCQREV